MAGETVLRVLHFEFPVAVREDLMVPAAGLLIAKIVEALIGNAR